MREAIFVSDPPFDAMSIDELRSKKASGDRARALGALARRSATDPSLLEEVLTALQDPKHRATKIMNVPLADIGLLCLWLANEQARATVTEIVANLPTSERGTTVAFFRQNEVTLDIASSPHLRVRYSEGNPEAPFGPGQWIVEVLSDDTVRVFHHKRASRAEWRARALPQLVSTAEELLARANFPARPSVEVAPAGAMSFSLTATLADGELGVAGGFISPEYSPVGDLFAQVVGQVSGDRVFGSMIPVDTQLVADVREVTTPGST